MARAARPPAEPKPSGQEGLTTLALAEILPNPRNPRHHSDDQLARLGASLKRDGQTKPLLLRRANRMLIGGHGVLEAARRIGWTEIRVILWDVDQPTADRVMLADNRLSDLAASDGDLVAELLREIDPADWFAAGYTPEEADKVFGGDEDLDVVEVDVHAVADEFWINVRGPLAHQAAVLARIKTLLGEFAQVSVELGTIAGD